jgi:hypothetical protein
MKLYDQELHKVINAYTEELMGKKVNRKMMKHVKLLPGFFKKKNENGDYKFNKQKGLLMIYTNKGASSFMKDPIININDIQYCYILADVTRLPENFLYYALNLAFVQLSENLQVIPKNFCNKCFNMTSIRIPRSVRLIDASFMAYCENLQSVCFSGKVNKIRYGFTYRSDIEKIYLYEKYEEHYKRVFQYDSKKELFEVK